MAHREGTAAESALCTQKSSCCKIREWEGLGEVSKGRRWHGECNWEGESFSEFPFAVGRVAMGVISSPSKKQALMPCFVESPCWAAKDIPSSASLPFAPCSVQL